MWTLNIDPLADDDVSKEFRRILGADPSLMREWALQTIYQQWPFAAIPPYANQALHPQPVPGAMKPVAPQPVPGAMKPGSYRQRLEELLTTLPQFTPPPAPQPVPAPPPIPAPPKPEPVQLPSPPEVPEPPAQWKTADFLPGLVAAAFHQDALPYVASGIEHALQQREARAQNRYERALSNALREWQVRMQETQANWQAQQAWQQQAYQTQVQNQQQQYQTQLQNIQAQNQYAQQKWAAEQDYQQWQWGQKVGALGKLAEQEAREEEKQLQRELQEQLRTDQFALQSFDVLMDYVGKPYLSASERQSALGLADALAEQFPRFKPMFSGMKASIQAKPSVPEQRVVIEGEKARALIAQGNERLAQGRARIALARQRMQQGQSKEALQALKDARSWLARLEDDVRATRAQLSATQTDPITLKTVPVISDPAERAKLAADLRRLEQQRDEAFQTVLKLEGNLVQQAKSQQPKPQQQQPTKPQVPPKPTAPLPPGWDYVFENGRWVARKVK